MLWLALTAALTFPDYRWPVLVITVTVISLLTLIHAKSFHAFTAVVATLICRLATLWFAVMIGGIVLAGLAINTKVDRHHAPDI